MLSVGIKKAEGNEWKMSEGFCMRVMHRINLKTVTEDQCL